MILFWTAVAAVAASASALFAAIYTGLTFRLVRAQGEPKVVVYVCGDPDRQSLMPRPFGTPDGHCGDQFPSAGAARLSNAEA
jgi:hypothetical protein